MDLPFRMIDYIAFTRRMFLGGPGRRCPPPPFPGVAYINQPTSVPGWLDMSACCYCNVTVILQIKTKATDSQLHQISPL